MTKISTNAMAKRHLEALGYRVDVTQHWIQPKGVKYGHRRDLFHCIDVIGLKGKEWLNVQACESESIHRAKNQARQNEAVHDIIKGPTEFEIWEFYNDGDGYWIRRWRALTAGGIPIEWEIHINEPSLDKEKEKEQRRETRRKNKQAASDQESRRRSAGDGTPF